MYAAETAAHHEAARASGRGHHKVFIGMAAGVGKTYRMLQEGHAEKDGDRDVAIGYMEPHKRPETSALADGLETLPRRRVTYRDTELEEMDLPGVLARAPEVALIDELAHTNPPGLEHEKRYEDVADVLEAGIDVFSTVNVQHLESLNDQVAELTGTRVRETIPDAVLGAADEVVLIDLTPEALIARLRAGKIYPGENIEAALNNFFTVENLLALREVALRQVAQEVEAKRLVVEEPLGTREERVAAAAPAGRQRARPRARPPSALLAATRPPSVALGAAARHRPRPALGEAPRAGDRRRGGAAGLGPAPARLGTRCQLHRRGERRPGRRSRRGRARARKHLHHGRRVDAPARPRAPARTAPPAADGRDAARRRRPDRRPPRRQGGRAQ